MTHKVRPPQSLTLNACREAARFYRRCQPFFLISKKRYPLINVKVSSFTIHLSSFLIYWHWPLSCICFFVGPLGALMALIMPGIGFNGYSLLLPRLLGYYGTHFMVLIEGLALVTFGLFKPRLHDLPRAVLITFVIGFAVFLFNVFLRRTGLHPKANYFFTMETEGNFVLEIFYKWIPYPFLYLLPSIVILATYMVIITIPFEILALKGS